jgi:hypothetical protein
MNKGIQMATGDWINFMNSGDRFSDDQVLHDVFFSKDFFNVSVIYGSWKVFYPATKRVQSRKAPSHLDLNYGSQFCHQASFIKTTVHKEFPYSLEESIVADFSFFFTLWKKGEVFQLIDRDVCIIEAGGVSDKKRGQVIRSWRMIVKPKLLKYKIYFSFRLLRESSVSLFKSISNWDL